MKSVSDLFAETLALLSAHHTEILQHVGQVLSAVSTAANPVAGVAVTVGEDALSVIMKRLDALEAKVYTVLPTSAQ